MEYIYNATDKRYDVRTSDHGMLIGHIIDYGNNIGWEFSPVAHIRLSYILLRRLYNKVYQLRKRDGQ